MTEDNTIGPGRATRAGRLSRSIRAQDPTNGETYYA